VPIRYFFTQKAEMKSTKGLKTFLLFIFSEDVKNFSKQFSKEGGNSYEQNKNRKRTCGYD